MEPTLVLKDIITKSNETITESITASEAIILQPETIIANGSSVTLSIAGDGFTESTGKDYAVSNITPARPRMHDRYCSFVTSSYNKNKTKLSNLKIR